MTRFKKLRAAFSAAAIAATAAVAGITPVANADQGNVVYFGDSITANPNAIINGLQGELSSGLAGNYPRREGCFQAPDNAPRQLAAMTGLRVDDWSCTGQTSVAQLYRVHRAIAVGDLNPGTRTVILPSSFNNFGPFGLLDKRNIFDHRAVADAYVADLHVTADLIRSVAPHAKIIIPGQLSLATEDSFYCWLNVVPGWPTGSYVPFQKTVERTNRDMQARAAREIGAEFVDILATSRYHDSCAPEERRFVAGFIDTTTPNYNMMFHPSRKGSEHIAQQLAPLV